NSPLSLPGKKSEPIYPFPTSMKEANNSTSDTAKVITLFTRLRNDHLSMPDIQLVSPVNPASKPYNILPKKVCLLIWDSLPIREYNHGTTVKETKKDNRVDTITVTQNWRRISETKPDDIAIGKNTTTITKVIADTVKPISFAPSYAALTLFLPISMWR